MLYMFEIVTCPAPCVKPCVVLLLLLLLLQLHWHITSCCIGD